MSQKKQSKKKHHNRERRYRRYNLLDILKEIIADANLDDFIDLHEMLVERYSMHGFFNESSSASLMHALLDTIIINNIETDLSFDGIYSDVE